MVASYYTEGDVVRATADITRGPLDEGGPAKVSRGTSGRVVAERPTYAALRYDVLFEGAWGTQLVHEVESEELEPAVWTTLPRRPARSVGYSVDTAGSEWAVLLAIGLLTTVGAWILGLLAWYPVHDFVPEEDWLDGGDEIGIPAWLGGLSLMLALAAVWFLWRSLRARSTVGSATCLAALGVAAATYWLLAPMEAHHELAKPYLSRSEARERARELFDEERDYELYRHLTRCAPGAGAGSRRPPRRGAHRWHCAIRIRANGHSLCRAQVRVVGWERYRFHGRVVSASPSCHPRHRRYITGAEATDRANRSGTTGGPWSCRPARRTHDPRARRFRCRSGARRMRLWTDDADPDRWWYRQL
jgi:hypothetical protein